MECKFQVGDPVVCIVELAPDEQRVAEHRGPILDEIYEVREVSVILHCDYKMYVGVKIKGITLASYFGQECAFVPSIFRKLLTIEDFNSKDVGLPVDRIKESELT